MMADTQKKMVAAGMDENNAMNSALKC